MTPPRLVAAFQGERGAFSEEAGRRLLGEAPILPAGDGSASGPAFQSVILPSGPNWTYASPAVAMTLRARWERR